MKDKIEQTQVFKNLEKFRKRIYSNPKNVAEIERLYGIAERLGFDYMVQNQSPNRVDKDIIHEILLSNEKTD